jgi:hypothetical protein
MRLAISARFWSRKSVTLEIHLVRVDVVSGNGAMGNSDPKRGGKAYTNQAFPAEPFENSAISELG